MSFSPRLSLPRLYVLADAATLEAQRVSHIAFATELRDSGVTLLQYRDKINGPQTVLQRAAEIAAVFSGLHATLLLNDRVDLAALAGWGVHVGQDDLSPVDARRLLGPTAVIGVSTHTAGQVTTATADADYLAVGPVFATATKLDAAAVVGLDGVRRARGFTPKPLVAIGGITLANARSAIDAGADSVAVISGMFVAGRSVAETARDFLDLLR